MFRLQNKIIFRLGPEQLGDRPATGLVVNDMANKRFEIRSPLAKIVVHIDRGNAGKFGSLLQQFDVWRGTQGVFGQ